MKSSKMWNSEKPCFIFQIGIGNVSKAILREGQKFNINWTFNISFITSSMDKHGPVQIAQNLKKDYILHSYLRSNKCIFQKMKHKLEQIFQKWYRYYMNIHYTQWFQCISCTENKTPNITVNDSTCQIVHLKRWNILNILRDIPWLWEKAQVTSNLGFYLSFFWGGAKEEKFQNMIHVDD